LTVVGRTVFPPPNLLEIIMFVSNEKRAFRPSLSLVVVAFAELGRVLVTPRRKPRDADSLSEHLKRDVGLRS
jgi:hypothetical protein